MQNLVLNKESKAANAIVFNTSPAFQFVNYLLLLPLS